MKKADNKGVPLPYLAAWRKQAYLSQRKLAERARISEDTIKSLEVGRCGARYDTIQALATALGIAPSDLVKVDPSTRIRT